LDDFPVSKASILLDSLSFFNWHQPFLFREAFPYPQHSRKARGRADATMRGFSLGVPAFEGIPPERDAEYVKDKMNNEKL
jgi:hypothetical protein